MDWIASKGGPLICMESKLKASWGGVEKRSVAVCGAVTDYDRACEFANYTNVIPVGSGVALVLGELKAETSLWYQTPNAIFVVQVPYSEPGICEETYLATLSPAAFLNPIGSVDLSIASDHMILFDSAEPGDDIRFKSISFLIDPGRYRILTQTFDPDPKVSFLLHKFEPI